MRNPELSRDADVRSLALSILLAAGCAAKAEGNVETQTPEETSQSEDGDVVKVNTSARVESIPTPAPASNETPAAEPTPPKVDSNATKLKLNLGNLAPGKHEINVNLDPMTRERLVSCVGQLGGEFKYTVDAKEVEVKAVDTTTDSERGNDVQIAVKNKGRIKPATHDVVAEAVNQCETELSKRAPATETTQQ